MLTKLLTRSSLLSLFLLLFFLPITHVIAQDSIRRLKIDSIRIDSVHKDTLTNKAIHRNSLENKVDYHAKDSLRFEIKDQKVFLYKEADIKYQDINLKAGYMRIDFPKNKVYATGIPDSTGKNQENPEFIEGGQTFKSKEINYNYTTKRGFINTVFTKQDEGYLHGTVVKKMENDVTYIKSGSYTTCDLEENPHFSFKFSKGKVIPGKRVITGPAYMDIANVATPLFIPFGYFPNRAGQRSGILLPTYGESANRGFYFENFGYYWAMNPYMDLTIQADIYTHGSWAIKPTFRYNKRYHYNGSFNFSYAVNLLGAADSPDFQKSKDFQVRWVHNQDAKARPHSSFSANVNIVSNTYNKYNLASSPESYLSNTFQSSINYSTNFAGKYYLNLNFNHSQNTISKTINITLPQVSFSVNQFYPFRRQNPVGKLKWYEQICLKYNLDMENRYNTVDSNFLKGKWLDSLQNGMRHSIPISASFRVLKFFNWTNSISINDRMYLKTIRKQYIDTVFLSSDSTTIDRELQTSYVSGFANAFDLNLTSSINTRIYGMYQFKGKGLIRAIRHMVTPTVAFTYTPNWGASGLGYWQDVANDPNVISGRYSIFEQGIYGGPPGIKSGLISFAISNNLEMKVRNRKDTINGFKKIPLIDDLTIRTSYDLARDSVNWAPITVTGRSTIINGLTVQYAWQWDMYARNAQGQRINTTEWELNHRLIRLDNTSWDVGLSYSLNSEKVKGKKTTTKGTPQERQDIVDYYDYYVDFDIPWNFSVNYSFRYTKTWANAVQTRVSNIVQTLNFNGGLNITPKWKITLTTGWDFVNGQLSYTSIDVYRDLHCWEMRFGWIPKGGQQSWNFSINVKASILQDLKLNKKRDFRDYGN
ncbi:MAG: putative LPS assembly protein LptD [Bacteroidales bacterium]|nr:LPS-assembly protein LptD [Bacteroidales bacterium]MDD4604089.1 putative LPS assembly protein LptD [Bacteroidales bacterium]